MRRRKGGEKEGRENRKKNEMRNNVKKRESE